MNGASGGTPRHGRHYSYTLYEKEEVAGTFDASRFSGPIGEFIAGHQLSFLASHMGPPEDLRILDVGAGTGRTALPLSRSGARVVAADASSRMLSILTEKAFLQGTRIQACRIDAHHLPFPDRSFDVVISLRMIMHVVDWRSALAELCRVARKRVMVDFPPATGFAGLAPLLHPLIRPFNRNHQSYKVFAVREIRNALRSEGFDVEAMDRHLVLPFGLHRAVNSLRFSRLAEGLLEKAGLRCRFGAPVTVAACRREDPAHDTA